MDGVLIFFKWSLGKWNLAAPPVSPVLREVFLYRNVTGLNVGAET